LPFRRISFRLSWPGRPARSVSRPCGPVVHF